MMSFDLKRNLIDKFTFDSATKSKAREEQNAKNLLRIEYFLYIGVPLYIFLFAIFYFKDVQNETDASLWKSYLLYVFSFIIIFLFIFGLTAVKLKNNKKPETLLSKLLPHFAFLIILISGAALAGVDQIISNDIISFLIACILAALLIYMSPLYSAIYYIFGFGFLTVSLHYFSPENVLLFSNTTHGLLIIVVSWTLSLILWQTNLVHIKKDIIIENQKDALAAHIKDLTNKTDELTIKTKALRSSNKTKDKLFSVISHDLRGPLANLTAMVQLLKNGDATESEFKEILPGLTGQINQTNELLENLLNWSKTNLQETKTNPETINLRSIASEITLLYKAQTDDKQLIIENNIESSLLAFADRNMVQIIIRNIFSNAIKFSHIKGNISLDSRAENDFIYISIKDEGIGIPKDKIKFLLTDDYSSTAGTIGEKGTGLGLILCRQFIEKNGGELWITSIQDKGSTFSFSLPVSR
ncbi:MAG: HAMP domain-containing sensor histidine kinase [Lentimicrobium sp.]|jgi:signal transduction histidine kinase|nr:HAMP domain-containing sensor histidine kinase [Lentimicrobium sp.]